MTSRRPDPAVLLDQPTLTSRADVESVLGFELSDEQWAAVSAPLLPTVIVAGAGTGKTTVMAARVLWLVATGQVAPGEVLGLTFTNKAAAELRDRIIWLLARWAAHGKLAVGQGATPNVLTYHSFAGQLLREQGLRVGVEPGARQLTPAAVLQLAYRIACSVPADIAAGSAADIEAVASPTRLAGQIVRLDGELAEQAISTEQLRAFDADLGGRLGALAKLTAGAKQVLAVAHVRNLLADLVDELRAAKAERGLDFADQMRLAVNLVGGPPTTPADPSSGPQPDRQVVRLMRSTYRVVLLDEYQDTSIAQRIILSGLFAGHPVTAVGDPLQAIYGWRSASVANIDQFGEHFSSQAADLAASSARPEAVTRVLSLNRRSGSAILAGANEVAGPLRSAHPEVAPLQAPQSRSAQVRTALLETHIDERSWVAEQVRGLVEAGARPQDIGILTRVGADLLPLAQAIASRGVPVGVAGRAQMMADPQVAEVVNTLQVLADPAANAALVGLLSGPRWRLGTADIAALGARARELSETTGSQPQPWMLLAVHNPGHAGISPAARERLAQLRAELAQLQREVPRGLVGLCHAVIAVTGAAVEAELAAAGGQLATGALDRFLSLVAGFADADGATSLGAFISWLELSRAVGEPPELDTDVLPGCVQLMTVHRAKGLEWPIVILPAMCDRRFPTAQASPRWPGRPDTVPSELRDDRFVLPRISQFSPGDLKAYKQACQAHDRSGEDRLAYVAITRARDVLLASGHWWGRGPRMRGPSPYLLALHQHDTPSPRRAPWVEQPQPGLDGRAPSNPLLEVREEYPWPAPPPVWAGRRMSPAVGAAVPDVAAPGSRAPDDDRVNQLAALDADIEVLLATLGDAQGASPSPTVPRNLSTTDVVAVLADPARAAADLARPMPRPRSRAADLGTRFHEWVATRLGQQLLINDEDLPGAVDAANPDKRLRELMRAFELLEYAKLTPAALEQPFVVALGDCLVRGRIDAVFHRGRGWEVVDWKTSGSQRVDPIQLAVYRAAWAQIRAVPEEQVAAAFVHVPTGLVVRPELPDSAELARILNNARGDGPRELVVPSGSADGHG